MYSNGIETRRIILENAEKSFIELGYEETSIRILARECNISSGALYKHFKNKEAILDAIVEPYIKKLWDRWSKEEEKLCSRLEKLKIDKDSFEGVLEIGKDHWAISILEENFEMWNFLLHESKGTKYENLKGEIVDRACKVSMGIIKLFYREDSKNMLFNEKEIGFSIEGFFQGIFTIFSKDNSQIERREKYTAIIGVYKTFWNGVLKV